VSVGSYYAQYMPYISPDSLLPGDETVKLQIKAFRPINDAYVDIIDVPILDRGVIDTYNIWVKVSLRMTPGYHPVNIKVNSYFDGSGQLIRVTTSSSQGIYMPDETWSAQWGNDWVWDDVKKTWYRASGKLAGQ
jgi:hypothetical protein